MFKKVILWQQQAETQMQTIPITMRPVADEVLSASGVVGVTE